MGIGLLWWLGRQFNIITKSRNSRVILVLPLTLLGHFISVSWGAYSLILSPKDMAGRYPIITLTHSHCTGNMSQYGHCSKATGNTLAGTDPSLLAFLQILKNTPVSAAPSFLILQHPKTTVSLRTLTSNKLLSPTHIHSDEIGCPWLGLGWVRF